MGQALVLITHTSPGGWHTRGWKLVVHCTSNPQSPDYKGARHIFKSSFCETEQSSVAGGTQPTVEPQWNKWLTARFPHGPCEGTYAEHSLCNNFSSENWRNLQGQLQHWGDVQSLVSTRDQVPSAVLGEWFLRPQKPSKDSISSDAQEDCSGVAQKQWAPPRTLTFQGGFLQDLHGVELTSVRSCDLPHQEHLRDRKNSTVCGVSFNCWLSRLGGAH